MNKFWMVYVEGSSGCRYVHDSLSSAKTEAERLARLESNVGRKVFVMESSSYAIVNPVPVLWVTVKDTL